jgi:hypothetical protein
LWFGRAAAGATGIAEGEPHGCASGGSAVAAGNSEKGPDDGCVWEDRAGAAGNPEARQMTMGLRCVAIPVCGRSKFDTAFPRMSGRAVGAAVAGAAVVTLLSVAIALCEPPLLAGTPPRAASAGGRTGGRRRRARGRARGEPGAGSLL